MFPQRTSGREVVVDAIADVAVVLVGETVEVGVLVGGPVDVLVLGEGLDDEVVDVLLDVLVLVLLVVLVVVGGGSSDW